MAAASFAWVWAAAGSALGAAGAALLLWALFWDRARGRRRCSRCWYDMGGVPGLRCPECGREARNERRLAKTRRGWRWAAAGILLMVAGRAGWLTPEVQHRGWIAATPSSVLALWAPAGKYEPPVIVGGSPASTPPTIAESLTLEAWERVKEGRMMRWQSQVFLSRVFRAAEEDPVRWVTLPDRWPAGVNIKIMGPEDLTFRAGLRLFFGIGGEAPAGVLGRARGIVTTSRDEPVTGRMLEGGLIRTARVELRGAGRVVYARRVPARVEIGGTVETFLDRIDSEGANEAVRAALDVRLPPSFTGFVARWNERSGAEKGARAWDAVAFGVVFVAEVVLDGEVLGRWHGSTEWSRRVARRVREEPIDWRPGGREKALAARDRLLLVVRGDPGAAGREYVHWPWDKAWPVCWAGEYRVGAQIEER